MDSVTETPHRGVVAGIAPHAGYVYSGKVAARTFRSISETDFDTFVIIGHDAYRNALAFTCPVDYFLTPLGKVPIDREMTDKIEAFNGGIRPDLSLHARDHTIEVQLPFLQVRGKPFKIVPVLFGNPTPENCRILSEAIMASSVGKRVFVLASTDMSHYPDYESAGRIDRSTLEAIKPMDVSGLFSHLIEQLEDKSIPNLQTPMCSVGGVGTAIFFSKAHGADKALILHYANSGDAPGGDKKQVVGYSSLLFLK